MPPQRVRVIGSHGHTVYHGPRDKIASTLQIGEPAVVAERTGIPVVADFRVRDIAAGGEGAPLVPAFDAAFFGAGAPRALLNIGGIANVTVVGDGIEPIAFDTGPGNCLLDLTIQSATHRRQPYDKDGRSAARGRPHGETIERLSAHPYFRRMPPKSTGRELFNAEFLDAAFRRRRLSVEDRLATLACLTARTVADSLRRFCPMPPSEVIVSGGGVYNRALMRHLSERLDPIPVRSIEAYGLHPLAKEPAAFAWFAWRAIRGEPNHLPRTTGAHASRILGALTFGNGAATETTAALSNTKAWDALD